MVDVNDTGMWNDDILVRVIEHIIKKVQTPIHRQPVLILLDSYATHKKHVEEKAAHYEKRNVFLRIIPPNMTGILQPLDVAVNRSFQQAYNDKYTEYLTCAVQSNDASQQTRSGNVKMPPYHDISKWITSWMKDQTAESLTKAFKLCGLVSSETFNVNDLHKPLQDCFEDDFTAEEWERQHAALILNGDDDFEESAADFIFFSVAFSFFRALFERMDEDDKKEGFDHWLKDFKGKVGAYINGDPFLKSLFNEEESILFNRGKNTGTRVEMFAAARILDVQLKINEVDNNCTIIGGLKWGEAGRREISLVLFEELFGISRI